MCNHPYSRLPEPDPRQPLIHIGLKFGDWMLIQAALLRAVHADLPFDPYKYISHGDELREKWEECGGREEARRVNNKIQECLDVIRDCIEAEQPFLTYFD